MSNPCQRQYGRTYLPLTSVVKVSHPLSFVFSCLGQTINDNGAEERILLQLQLKRHQGSLNVSSFYKSFHPKRCGFFFSVFVS